MHKIIAAILLILLTAAGVRAAEPGTISGRITDSATGAGVGAATVCIFGSSVSYFAFVVAGADGSYSAGGLSAGTYIVSAQRQGYISGWYGGTGYDSAAKVGVTASGAAAGIDISLAKGGTIAGHVTDAATGAPLVGVSVAAFDAANGSAWGATTDATGAYLVDSLPTGAYRVRIGALGGDSYVTVWYGGGTGATAPTVAVTAPGGVTGIDAALAKGGTISGCVTDAATGQGLEAATVLAIGATGEYYAVTGADGAYTVTGLSTGNYTLRFHGTGYIDVTYQSGAAVAVTAPAATTGIDAILAKGATIAGRVTDAATGGPLQGVMILLGPADDSFAIGTSTDADGRYSVSGLPTGTYYVEFLGAGAGYFDRWYGGSLNRSGATAVVVTAPAIASGIDAALAKGGSISGRVTDAATGTPLLGAYVSATDSLGSYHSASTDSDGAYTISPLPSGDYKITFNFSGSGYVTQSYGVGSTVKVTAPGSVSGIDARLVKGGSITGRVTDKTTGAAIPFATVVAYPATGMAAEAGFTDAAGAYTIDALSTGSYRVEFQEPAHLAQWYGAGSATGCPVDVTVTAPGTTSGIDAALDKAGTITGRVTAAATGAPIEGITVRVSKVLSVVPALPVAAASPRGAALGTISIGSPDIVVPPAPDLTITPLPPVPVITPGPIIIFPGPIGPPASPVIITTPFEARTDADGVYTLTGLADGDYSVRFSGYWYVESAREATVAALGTVSGVDAALAMGGAVSGKVSDRSTGSGIPGVLVAVTGVGNAVRIAGITDSAGNYRADGLPEGDCTVHFNGRSAGYLTGAYTGAGGGTDPATVTVAAAIERTGIDGLLDPGGTVAGVVTGLSGAPLANIAVVVYDGTTGAGVGSTVTSGDGSYAVGGLSSGSYRVRFIPSPDGNYAGQWYPAGTDEAGAALVTVAAPGRVSGIDASLRRGGAISGAIRSTTCPEPQAVTVRAYDAGSGKLIAETFASGPSLGYTIAGLPPGSYKIEFSSLGGGFRRQWYRGGDFASAEAVTVAPPGTTTGIDAILTAGGGGISGRLDPGTAPLGTLVVKVYDAATGSFVCEQRSSAGGTYGVSGLPAGDYRVLFTGNRSFAGMWYRTPGDSSSFTPVTVSGTSVTRGIDAFLSAAPDGDLDGSGGPPGIADVMKLLRIAVGLAPATSGDLLHGDLSPTMEGCSIPDGKIDIGDALMLLRLTVGLALP